MSSWRKPSANWPQRTAAPKTRSSDISNRGDERERSYEEYVSRLGIYNHALSNQERAILRVTRRLGECDMAPPPDYLMQMSRYIDKWKSTNRFVAAVNLAQQRGYTKQHRRGAESAGSTRRVLLPRHAGKQFSRRRGGTLDAIRLRQGHVDVHQGYGSPLRPAGSVRWPIGPSAIRTTNGNNGRRRRTPLRCTSKRSTRPTRRRRVFS